MTYPLFVWHKNKHKKHRLLHNITVSISASTLCSIYNQQLDALCTSSEDCPVQRRPPLATYTHTYTHIHHISTGQHIHTCCTHRGDRARFVFKYLDKRDDHTHTHTHNIHTHRVPHTHTTYTRTGHHTHTHTTYTRTGHHTHTHTHTHMHTQHAHTNSTHKQQPP